MVNWSFGKRVAIQAVILAVYIFMMTIGRHWIGFGHHILLSVSIVSAAWLFGLRGAIAAWVCLLPLHLWLISFPPRMDVDFFELEKDGVIYGLDLVTALLIGYLRRITDRLGQHLNMREHEASSLSETKARIEAILNSTLQISYLVDREGRILAYNRNAKDFVKRYLNISLRIGDSLVDIAPEHLRDGLQKNLAKCLKGEVVQVKRITHPDSADGRAFHAAYVPVRSPGGRINAVCLTLSDITDIELGKRQVDDQLKFVERLLDTLPIPVFYQNTETELVGFNKAFETFSGHERHELLGRTAPGSPSEAQTEAYLKRDRELLKTGGTQMYEGELVRANGDHRKVVYRKAAYEDSLGQIAGIVGVVTDVTERKRQERRNQVLLNIAQAADNTDNLRDLLAIVRDELGSLIDTSNFYVALYDELSGTYSFPYHADVHQSEAIENMEDLHLENSLTDWVRRSNQPELVNLDRHAELTRQGEVRRLGVPSAIWLGVPLRVSGRAIGIIAVQHYEEASCYTVEDRDVLAFVADHIARAVERKQAEVAVRKARSLSDVLMETVPGGVIQFDMDGWITSANGDALRSQIFGGDSLLGRNLRDALGWVLYDDGTPMPIEEIPPVRCLRTGKAQPAEVFGLRHPDGGTHWFTAVVSPLRDEESGEQLGAVLAFLDVTSQREAEATHQLTRMSFDYISELTLWLTEDGRIANANRGACETLGYSLTEMQSKSIWDIDNTLMTEKWVEVWEEGKSQQPPPFESRFVGVDGSAIPVELSVAYVEFRDHEYGVVVARDITQRKKAEEELRKTRDWLDRVVSLSSAVVYSCGVGPDYPITFISDNITALLGFEPAAFYEDPHFWTKRIHPDDLPMFEEQFSKLKSDSRISYEYRVRHSSGRWLWLYDEISIQRDEDGHITGLVGSWFDISERRQAEMALRESEEKHRRLLQNLHAGVVVHGANGDVIFGNHRAKQLLGLAHSHLLGRSPDDDAFDFVDEDENPIPKEQYPVAQVIATHRPLENHTIGVRSGRGRSIRWLFGSLFPVMNADGEVDQVVATFIDITDRKLADQAITESAERYRQIFENNSAIKLLIDPATARLVDANEAASRFYGYTREELTGKPVCDINVAPEPQIRSALEHALTHEAGFFEFRHRLKSGEIRNVEVHSGPIDLSGKKLLFSIVQDVTERKRAEQAVQSRDRILSAVAEAADIMMRSQNQPNALNRMLGRLGEATGISRVYLFQNDPLIPGGELCASQQAEWVSDGISSELDNPSMQNMPYRSAGFDGWIERLSSGVTIQSRVVDLPEAIQPMMEEQSIQSLIIVPIFVNDRWWGFLGFDDCETERAWSSTEIDALRVAAGVVGSSYERKFAEQALLESAQRLAFLFQQTPLGVVEWDMNGQVTDWNPAAERIFGYRSEEMIGKGARPLIPDHMRDEVRQAWQDLIAGRGGTLITIENVTKSGELRWCEWHSTTLLNDRGDVIGTASLILDVTEQRRAEQQLRDSEEQHREMYNRTPVMLQSIDRDGNISSVSDFWLESMGYTREEVIGRQGVEFLTPESRRNALDEQIPTMFERGWSSNFALKIVRKDGTVRDVESSAIVQRDELGEQTGALMVLIDVTDRNRAEEALVRAREEYRVIFHSVPAMIWYKDTENRILRVNATAAHMVGREPRELEGRLLDEIFGDAGTQYYDADREVIRTGQPKLGNIEQVVFEDARVGWVRTDRVPLADADGDISGILVISQDITQIKLAEEELRFSDEILRQLTDAVITTNLDGIVERWLAGAERLFGYTATEMNGREFRSIQVPRENEIEDLKMESDLRNFGLYVAELNARRKDGTIIPIETRVQMLYDTDGLPVGMISLSRDIRERKAAEEALRKSEQRFRLLFESAPMGILSCDIRGRILDINPTLLRIVGSPTVLDGGSMDIDDFPPLKEIGIEREITECLTGGQPVANEGSYVSEWGTRVHLRYLLTPMRNDDGETTGLQVMIEDISERVQSEQELKKLSAAVSQSANAICITDVQGNVEYINPRFTNLTGYSIMEVVGRPISVLRSGKHDRAFYNRMWEAITEGKTWTGMVENRRRNGEMYCERKTISPIFDDRGEILHFVSIGEDITNEIKTQQKLAESDKLAAVGMLAAGVSHEFKNYLGGIIGNASFALEELEEQDSLARETLEQIIEMGEKANQVAMSLLTYSKAKPDDFTREDLSLIIRNSINLVEKELKNRSIELVTYFDKVPDVDVSASKIQQLLLNLIINAEHAIDTSGVITIALLKDDSQVFLKVGDTGGGIAPDNLAKIFDPFFSTKGVWGKDKLVGSGMGLSICRNIAREHGGELTVESRLGMGTTFTLGIPLVNTPVGVERTERGEADFRRVLIFSLERSILKTYFEPACENNTSVFLIDTITSISDQLGGAADLVVIDSNFSGKLELLRLVELCRAEQVPYVMINCGAMEYQLSDLYDHAAANFSNIPAFDRVLDYARRIKPNRTPVK